ncbi:MAG: dihydroorotate dehydrogenase [Hyphomicrobiales bacterium]|jgi:dihydroorotate dehydrogenase|nr:dihydroorotate dehydrogenase [Hyphomicrobiales bacterium]
MMRFIGALSRPLLFALDPEDAHAATIKALRMTPIPMAAPSDPRLATSAFGLNFPNPIGMAAGFDKGAEVPGALLKLGFGFVEVGTVTPAPQPGNSRPRLFRLVEDEAVINRFGFNSEGQQVVHDRLRRRAGPKGVVGVNIGANKDAFDRVSDYVSGVAALADVASYFAVNVSSPNTPGLRDLQQAAVLDDLLARVLDARDRVAERHGRKPILLKISPDMSLADLDDVVRVCLDRGVDGMIVTNTTISRPPMLTSDQGREAGGLSGKPIFAMSTKVLAQTYLRVEGKFPLIGAGGINDVASAFAKIEAGATLLQLYSALVYKGPGLVADLNQGLLDRIASEQLPSLAPAIGRKAKEWAAE